VYDKTIDLGGRLVSLPEVPLTIPAPQIYDQRYKKFIINMLILLLSSKKVIIRFKMMQWLTKSDAVLMQEIKLPKFYRSLVHMQEETNTADV